MSTETTEAVGGYGYASDEVKQSTFRFGLNAGKTFLKKFEWIPNGGKDGAEGEALDIIFDINGTDKSYRQFPVTKAFDKNNNPITDPNSAEMKDALSDFNAKMTHILHCFQDIETIKATFAKPIKNFKDFATTAMSILPKEFNKVPLDIFLQYQWTLKEGQKRTYLEIPSKMKYGKWLAPAQAGTWTEIKAANPDTNDGSALYYQNENQSVHPFIKNGWFMNSNLAKQQVAEGERTADNTGAAIEGSAIPAATADGAKAAW